MGAYLAPDGVKLLLIARGIGYERSKAMEVQKDTQPLMLFDRVKAGAGPA